jgi:fructan beta-fructosidase
LFTAIGDTGEDYELAIFTLMTRQMKNPPIIPALLLALLSPALLQAQPYPTTLDFRIDSRYVNIPVESKAPRQRVVFDAGEGDSTVAVIRIAQGQPDYWVFRDVSALRGRTLTMRFASPASGIARIHQADRFPGQDSLYRETKRPQLHFSPRRGWNNDPNGLVWKDGEYHLFFQHNPYERDWENMHWGHAVSRDLLHWEELPEALFPDTLGTMFSGSAVVDARNTSGWGKDALVAVYTAAGRRMTQNVAYSLDNGRTFTKYKGNPLLGPDRDPKVFWYEPGQHWVMALYNENHIAIYNSRDLKSWTYKSRVRGFYECPELFELPVDGNEKQRKWVMYAASGTYMIGSFDGAVFTPEKGKYHYHTGAMYAAQTFNHTPEGRRIQIGWGRIDAPGMPFTQLMLFPQVLTLRTTAEGVRLHANPIPELERLHARHHALGGLSVAQANERLKDVKSDLVHAVMDIEIDRGLGLELFYQGNPILYYDGNYTKFNGFPYESETPGAFRFRIEMILDRTSVEGYVDGGRLFVAEALKAPKSAAGLELKGDLKIHRLDVYELKGVWDGKY